MSHSTSHTPRIGFVGLGHMGEIMARNLQAAGHRLVVFDVSPDAMRPFVENGAEPATSPADLGSKAEVVFTSLPTPAIVESVVLGADGLINGIRAGAALFDLSTNAISVIKRIGDAMAERDVAVLDAPVSGYTNIAIWAGGDSSVFDRWLPVLQAIGPSARYIGPLGAGTIAKLVHNCASSIINMMVAEVMSLGVAAGLEPLPLWEAIRQGARGKRGVFEAYAPFLTGKFEPPDFAFELLCKDMGLAMALASESGVSMPLAEKVFADMKEALGRGWGGLDSRVMMLLQLERAGLEPLAVPADDVKAVIAKG